MMLSHKKNCNFNAPQRAVLKLFFVGGFLIMLFGCREYQQYHYETIKDFVMGGELSIELVPSRKLLEKEGKKIAVEADPYSILFKFFSDIRFKGIEVRELTLTGVSSEIKLNLSSAVSLDARKHPESGRFFAIASFSKSLQGSNVTYEPYDLSATLILVDEHGSEIESQINYRLMPSYKKGKRSDIIDGMMGI